MPSDRDLIGPAPVADDLEHLPLHGDDHDATDLELIEQLVRNLLGTGRDEDPVEGTGLGQSELPGCCGHDLRVLAVDAAQNRLRRVDESSMAFDTRDPPLSADEDAEQRRRPSRARTEVEDPVAEAHVEEFEHIGDRARLGVRLTVADGHRDIALGQSSFGRGQEGRPRHRSERLGDRNPVAIGCHGTLLPA